MSVRLQRRRRSPLVVAFSGGGDSLFLLLAAKIWAAAAGRRIIAVTVDHGLQPDSASWASWCAVRASELGVEHRTLRWAGAKPTSGLPATARRARHELIASLARETAATVVLFGHTADDAAESRLMRLEGASVPEPRLWSPSSAWPRGRGVFTLRPLLPIGREVIRRELTAAGQEWIEDSFNSDERFARTRARRALAHAETSHTLEAPAEPSPRLDGLLGAMSEDPSGGVTLLRSALRGETADAVRIFLGAALLCVSGSSRPARGVQLTRLTNRLLDTGSLTAVLAGTRVEAHKDYVRLTRETGDFVRCNKPPTLDLPERRPIVWDGRFEIEARAPGLKVRPLAGVASRLTRDDRRRVRLLWPASRRALPALISECGVVRCPTVQPDHNVRIRPLSYSRLMGACGVLRDEAAARHVALTPWTS